jgi:hypothetical protein
MYNGQCLDAGGRFLFQGTIALIRLQLYRDWENDAG